MGGKGRGDRRAGAAAAGRGGLPLSGVLPPPPRQRARGSRSASAEGLAHLVGGVRQAGRALRTSTAPVCHVAAHGPWLRWDATPGSPSPAHRGASARNPMCTEPLLCSRRRSPGRVSAPRSPVRGSRAVPGHPAQGLLAPGRPPDSGNGPGGAVGGQHRPRGHETPGPSGARLCPVPFSPPPRPVRGPACPPPRGPGAMASVAGPSPVDRLPQTQAHRLPGGPPLLPKPQRVKGHP